MQIEKESLLSQKEKLFLLSKFVEEHPEALLQDFYKWLYLGEFGAEESSMLLTGKLVTPELHVLLAEIKQESSVGMVTEKVWEPMGLSGRFVKVYVSKYYELHCPLKRLVNLLERSPAFRGSRMAFKLDWSLMKETVLELKSDWNRRKFINFEEKINFHQLPSMPFSDTFSQKNPHAYRIVSQKLFFEYFPEFEDPSVFHPFLDNNSLAG